MKTVDAYFSIVSPWAYFGHQRLVDMCAKTGAKIILKPCSLGHVFPTTGGVPLAKRAQERQDYRFVELERWRKHLGVALNLRPAHFPVPDLLGGQVVLAAQAQGLDDLALAGALMRAVWVDEKDISDPDTVAAIASSLGLDGAALVTAANDYGDALKANGEGAVSRGVFGFPFYFVGDEGFWGQDRLDFVERALTI